jgi:hypothetical protein
MVGRNLATTPLHVLCGANHASCLHLARREVPVVEAYRGWIHRTQVRPMMNEYWPFSFHSPLSANYAVCLFLAKVRGPRGRGMIRLPTGGPASQ